MHIEWVSFVSACILQLDITVGVGDLGNGGGATWDIVSFGAVRVMDENSFVATSIFVTQFI